jgi:hypothetical protein
MSGALRPPIRYRSSFTVVLMLTRTAFSTPMM